MSINYISNNSSERLGELQDGKRTVLYEEMAEYFYLFSRTKALKESSVKVEVDYHIGNLVLLSFYFDIVLIQTATIFNVSDPFVQKIIDNVVSHQTFKGMINANKLKIVGWGGNSPKEMFEAADSFSKSAMSESEKNKNSSAKREPILAPLFTPESVITRSSNQPDKEVEELFKSRLEQTTIIREQSNFESVEFALNKSLEKTGQLVAISFKPEVNKLELSSSNENAVGLSFIQSWHDHLSSEIPGVITYAPMTNSIFAEQKIVTSTDSIRTFLYSPQIFASFLSGYIRPKDFNKILNRPFDELEAVKNGDWKRFSDAYHSAIIRVSENIGHLGLHTILDNQFSDQTQWAQNISNIIENSSDKVDVNAFIESLAMLSGVVFSLPFLSPIFKSTGVFVGKKVNDTFDTFKKNATTEISPFIQKLCKHYELEGTRA